MSLRATRAVLRCSPRGWPNPFGHCWPKLLSPTMQHFGCTSYTCPAFGQAALAEILSAENERVLTTLLYSQLLAPRELKHDAYACILQQLVMTDQQIDCKILSVVGANHLPKLSAPTTRWKVAICATSTEVVQRAHVTKWPLHGSVHALVTY